MQQNYAQSSLGSAAMDDALILERMESFAGGEDAFRRSTLIDPDQCQKLVNMIVRDNFEARTRPGADALNGAAFSAGITRGLFYFDTPGYQLLLAAMNAKLFKWDGAVKTQLSWSPVADARVSMAQGVDKVLISDGIGNCQVYDGANFIDCPSAPANPPVGATILKWHAGRMFASGVTALADTIFVSNRLDFGIGQWNSVTRSFRVGAGDGDPIVALAPMQDFVLCVFKRNSIWPIVTDPRNEPANFSADQSTPMLTQGIGCVGRDAWCTDGNDILFMSQDGVRSVRRMLAAAGQREVGPPLSQPIQGYIDRINRNAWDKICAVKYQEFAFFFVPLDISSTNNACLVWNWRLGRWIGLWEWSGQAVAITRFNGVNKLVFGDEVGRVNQWKDTSDLASDATYQDNGADYGCKLWTRSFLFGEAVNNKSAYSTVLRFSQGNATVNLSWVADLAVQTTWTGQPAPTGDILGIGTLPFQLATTEPIKVEKGIRGLVSFNEAYLRIESNKGWWALRNVSAAAFVNPLRL